MRSIPCIRRSHLALAALLVASTSACSASAALTGDVHSLGINGQGIDIRPASPLQVGYFEQPGPKESSPYEALDLDFAVAGDASVNLVVGGAKVLVTRTQPARLSYQVRANENGEKVLVVRRPGAARYEPATPAGGTYNENSPPEAPEWKKRAARSDPETVVVRVHGLWAEVVVER